MNRPYIFSDSNVFEIYFELVFFGKNRNSIFRGFTVHISISLTNVSKYFRFAKELALYQNDNYVGCNENVLIYNGCSKQDYLEIGEETQITHKLAYKWQ